MATHTHTPPSSRWGGTAPSRREILGATGFAGLFGIAAAAFAKPDAAPAAPSAHHSDAELFALHDRFMVLQKDMDADDGSDDNVTDALCHAQAALLDEMGDLQATTMAGCQARIRVLSAWYVVREGHSDSAIEGHRIWPLFRDIMAGVV